MIKKSKEKSRLIKNIATSFVSLAVFFICFEIFLRIFNPQPVSALKFSPSLIWMHMPNASYRYIREEFNTPVKFNSLGLRDYEHSLKKPTGVFRITLLGDSVAEGAQVKLDDTVAKRLERFLNAGFKKKKYEVINFGVGGYGTTQELIMLEEKALQFKPDLILLFFCSNDVTDNIRTDLYSLNNGKLIPNFPIEKTIAGEVFLNMKYFIRLHSHVYKFFSIKWYKLRLVLKKNPERYGFFDFFEIFEKEYPENFKEGWTLTKILLSEIRDKAKLNGAKIAIVITTLRHQLDVDIWNDLLMIDNFSVNDYDLEKPNRILIQFGKDNLIPVLDLVPIFKKYVRDGEELHYKIDGHWNSLGNNRAAREIYNFLLNEGLI